MLWRQCQKLWSNRYINAFWATSVILRLKLFASGRVHVIIPSEDLDELFPENELLTDKQ